MDAYTLARDRARKVEEKIRQYLVVHPAKEAYEIAIALKLNPPRVIRMCDKLVKREILDCVEFENDRLFCPRYGQRQGYI